MAEDSVAVIAPFSLVLSMTAAAVDVGTRIRIDMTVRGAVTVRSFMVVAISNFCRESAQHAFWGLSACVI
eukprot:scaffold15119_cov63-Cyclotella_meneghiniana.AAC.12